MGTKHEKHKFGAHFSIAKGLHNAVYQANAYGCNTLQVFTKNATTWKERMVTPVEQERFERAKTETGIHTIFSHTSYLINLASPDPKKHAMSYSALKQELIRSSALKIPYCVLHPGSHMGSGIDAGLLKISESLNRIFSETTDTTSRLLLETTAGQGSGLGHKFEQLSEIMDRIDLRERIGICLDTCHVFAAGYDLRTPETYQQTMNHFDTVLGLEQLHAIHINDSKKDLGSRVDRHTHIGKGTLGKNAFKQILNDESLLHIPKLLETAHTEGEMDWTAQNLDLLRSLAS